MLSLVFFLCCSRHHGTVKMSCRGLSPTVKSDGDGNNVCQLLVFGKMY